MRTIRSFSKYLVACGMAAAMLVGGTTANAASAAYARITTVSGDAQYTAAPGGSWTPLKAGAVLPSGAVIKTGAGSYVYMAINNRNSAVRVAENTTLGLEKMLSLGDNDSDTTLDVKVGTIAGDVKKLAKASHFDIRTPNGVAGIRGTTWTITVSMGGNQLFSVNVTCVNGQVVIASTVSGNPVTTVLTSGQSIILLGGQQVAPTVTQAGADLLLTYTAEINGLTVVIQREIKTDDPIVPIIITRDNGGDNNQQQQQQHTSPTVP